MLRALPRVPLGGSDQIRRLQVGAVPIPTAWEPWLVPPAAVPSASARPLAVGLVGLELGTVAVAGRAEGLPTTGA